MVFCSRFASFARLFFILNDSLNCFFVVLLGGTTVRCCFYSKRYYYFFRSFCPSQQRECLSPSCCIQPFVDFLGSVRATHVCISLQFYFLLISRSVVYLCFFFFCKLHLRRLFRAVRLFLHSIKSVRIKWIAEYADFFRSGMNTSWLCDLQRTQCMHENMADAEPIWNSYLRF